MTNHKNTLNLPDTEFPMRANLGEREPLQIQLWDEWRIYERMQERREGADPFILHDGPPYANGHLHHGHMLNKSLKDFIVKYKNMAGFSTPFIPGWDCHGLPIEQQVAKNLLQENQTIKDLDQNLIRKKCREYADEHINIQREEFKRMMVFADWENPYKTMNFPFEAATLRILADFFEKNLVYHGLKPVHWDWHSETALAEAELEYKAFRTEHVYVKFALEQFPESWKESLNDHPLYCVIWTTTPWTLPSNLAIALNPDLDYSLVLVEREGNAEAYVIADGLRESFEEACRLSGTTTLLSFKGKELVGNLKDPIKYYAKHPFISRDSALIAADYVTLEQGTGCVHTAPGHGIEDFEICQYYNIEPINPVDDSGKYKENEVERWGGKHVLAANKEIQKFLHEIGALVNQVGDKVTIERYPHGWRSKKPLIFRTTNQWFVPMDGMNGDSKVMNVRKEVLEAIDRIGWVPSWGRERIVGMYESRPDWCISRQRSWGVPITVFYCECGHIIADAEITRYIATLFEDHGADVWFENEPEELVPPGTTCPKCHCAAAKFTKGKDILDVWFDSGTTWAAVLEDLMGLRSPSDLYLEGSDQHRGWFNSSLTCKMVARGTSPYRTCLTHGFIVGEDGLKFSKSSKNFESPQKFIDDMGAEILRLWVAAVDYRADITFSKEVIGRISDSYRKIRNTIRYLLGNLYDFTPNDILPYDQLEDLDKWLLDRTARVLGTITRAYDQYHFHTVYHSLVQLCTVDLSSVHMDISKDRVYCSAPNSPRRRSAQTAYWYVLDVLLGAIAPILSFTAEEAWSFFPKSNTAPESIFLTDFPSVDRSWLNDDVADRWEQFLLIRDEVQKALEAKRVPRKEKKPGQIGSSQEAIVHLTCPPDQYDFLKPYEDQLAELFITSGATLSQGDELSVTIQASEDGKCPRCWNYWVTDAESEVCPRCHDALQEIN